MKIKKEQDSKNELLQNSAKKADIVVQKFIDLYKSFPGYTDLNVDDQIAVLKGTVSFLSNTTQKCHLSCDWIFSVCVSV